MDKDLFQAAAVITAGLVGRQDSRINQPSEDLKEFFLQVYRSLEEAKKELNLLAQSSNPPLGI